MCEPTNRCDLQTIFWWSSGLGETASAAGGLVAEAAPPTPDIAIAAVVITIINRMFASEKIRTVEMVGLARSGVNHRSAVGAPEYE
jgi:hypothetical protein